MSDQPQPPQQGTQQGTSGTKQTWRRAGLCATCVHLRVVTSDRSSEFVRCEKSQSDSRFPKYPRLPVIACEGYERRAESRSENEESDSA